MDLTTLLATVSLFVICPWVVMHYVTRWKIQGTLTNADENMMEELYDLARRLEDRMSTVERIMSADNPGWRTLARDPARSDIGDPIPTERTPR
jgi:phage shock protein B